MCHLCQKIQALEGLDYKATKPVFVILSKLHKYVSPHLGDIYLWRLSQTTNLHKLLAGIYRNMPIAPLKAILDEVDNEIQHVRKGMADHPSKKGVGKLDVLKDDVTPSESPSLRMMNVIELEAGRKLTRSEVSARNGGVLGRITDEERALWATMPELPGSDPDPPESKICWSIRYVEEWMEKCDAAMRSGHWTPMENTSMVSLIGGRIQERPALDIGVWIKQTFRSKSKKRTSRTGSYDHTSKKPSTKASEIPHISECVYDKPPEKIELDMHIIGEIVQVATTEEEQERCKKNLTTLLLMKKAEKLGKSRRISVHDAIQLIKAKKERALSKFTMSGGRSYGLSPRTSAETFRANSSQGRSSFSSHIDSVELTRSEAQRCVEQAGATKQVKRRHQWESEPESDWTASSRDSIINIGSIVGQGERVSGSQDDDEECRVSSSMRSVSSRESVINMGSLIEQPRLVKDYYQSWGGSVSSDDSFRPSTPKPIEKAQPVTPIQRRGAPKRSNEDIRAPSQHIPSKPDISFAEHMAVRGLTMSGASDITASPAVLARRRRRAERNESVAKMDRYKNEERQRLWRE